jgi:hypothetical protein
MLHARPAAMTMPLRPLALAALAVAVAGLHLWVADDLLVGSLALHLPPPPAAIEVSFVRELQPAAPAVVRAGVAPGARRVAVAPATAPPASAPGASAGRPAEVQVVEAPPGIAASAPTALVAEAAASPPASTPAPVAEAVATAASAPAFEWPPSTRMSYTLTGYHRGPVEGQARVEWRRDGARYQVEVTVEIGPFFAPLMSRTALSAGEITEAGLRPRRYVEDTRVAFAAPRRREIRFDEAGVELADGRKVPRPEGTQDSASQFVQLTWMFTLNPQRLQPGQVLVMPLALPHRVEPWLYDVVTQEVLHTPFGAVDAVHVKPRRPPRPGFEMTAEMWIAPSLQYLPVRILIHQDAESWIDLLVQRLPQQAAPR